MGGFRSVTLGLGSTGLQRGRSGSCRTRSFRPLIPRPVAWRLSPCGRVSGVRGFSASDAQFGFDWAGMRTLRFRPEAWFPASPPMAGWVVFDPLFPLFSSPVVPPFPPKNKKYVMNFLVFRDLGLICKK